MPSTMGYLWEHFLHTSSSPFSFSSPLQRGQARIFKSSLLIGTLSPHILVVYLFPYPYP